MANIYQLWDNTVLNSANATPEQLEQKRNELKTRFESIAREKGVASKDIYATIDKFDQYSRQKTTTRDDGLTPDEREAAQDDGSTILGLNKGGLKEGAKAIKDLGLGIVSSVPRVVGDLAQTWSDVGDNDPSELSAQLARKAYDASEDIKSNYSEGTKKAKKDFWSPAGLAMGIGENLGQVALSAGLVGGASKGAMALSKGSKAWGLGAGLTTGMGLAYGQGYGQGKENALEKINNTSNEDLYANVVAEFDDWQKSGAKKSSKPEIVSLYEEAEGDLNKMKDLMAEDAGAWAGILTAVTAPIAMGATAFMNRGAINQMAAQGGGNIITRNLAFQTGARDAAEFARRVAARDAATGLGGKIAANASIARQGLKIAGKQSGLQTVEEGAQEWGEGYFAADAGSLARGDKGVLSDKDWDEVNQQGLQGAAIGALMGGGGSLLTMRDAQNNGVTQAKARTELPKQYQDSFNAFEDAKQAEAQAQAAHEANPTPESEEALAQATDARLKANNQFNQYDAAFKQSFTEQEQQDLLANDLKGIAARAKLAEEAKQAELNSKAEQDALAKAQRANMVKGLAAYADNEEVLLNKVNQLGLDDTQKELLLREVFAERKNAKDKPQQTNGQPKTPLELAVDEHFDAKGNRKPSVMSQDVADKHKVSLNELLPAIAKRNNDIKIQKAQAEKKAKQQAQLDEDAKAFQQSQAKLEADAKRKAQEQQKAKEQGLKQDALTEKQQLENTLADFAAENDTDSMLSMLEGYDKTEADKLFNNAFKTVETRAKEAEKAAKAKEVEATKQKQLQQKQSAFNADMAALYESNPNATYNDWKAIGKKHGVTSAIDLASAWASLTSKKPVKNQEQANPTKPLALPAPNNVMVTDAQGNTTQTTENNVPKKQRNADVSVPSGLKVDVSNTANTQRDRGVGSYIGNAYIVRQDGKPFPTEQVAQQALENKATKKTKPKKNEPVITKDTHTVVPVDGGFAIAPVEAVTQKQVNTQADDTLVGNKKNPDNDNGGVPVEPVAPKPVSPMGGNNTPQATPNTTGEQIAQAMDKTAQAITEAAHNKVVERVKNGEEIVYKQPAAIERVKQDERYQVELNDKGHAVVKNVKDNDGNWVGSEPVVTKEIKQPKQANKTVNTENDDLLTAIAKLGGLSREESVKKFGIDPAQTNIRKAGLLPVFRKDAGLSFDDMAKTLHGYGYPVSDNGQYSPNALYEALDDALRGREIGTSEYHEKQMEQKYAERMREEAEFYDAISKAGSSTWEEADNIEAVADAMVTETINNNSTISKDLMASTLKEVENVSDSTSSRQDNDTTAKTQSIENSNAEVASSRERGQQESQRDSVKTTQSQGLQGLALTSQTEASRKQEEDAIKAAETKRLAEEKAAKDKAQADKELNDFRLTGSNAPADIAMAGGQKDMFAPPTRGEREKAKGFTENQKPTKPFSAPSENLPETTIMRFLNDGELENAYFFAENQDKPIKFTLSEKKEPIAYFLTEPVDLGNGIKGFVGLASNVVNKEGRKNWLVIEEKSRKSIGFEEISKQAAIKSAKARLSALKKDDLERILSNIKPINKTDEEMKADWLAKNNIKTDDEKTEQQNINKKSAAIENLYDLALPTSGLVDVDKLKSGETSIGEFISANGLDFDDFIVASTSLHWIPTEKTQYQTLISEMLGIADEHIASAEKKRPSNPQERKAKDNRLSIWRGAIEAIKIIERKRENPFTTSLAVRRDIPKLLKTRFENKFASLSDAEKYNQYILQAKIANDFTVNKAIEWALKEKDKNSTSTEGAKPLAPVEKAQQAKKDAFLNTEVDSAYGTVTKKQLLDNLINDGWTLSTGWTEDKAKGKALDTELDRLKRTAPWGNTSHPDTIRLNELKNLAKESPHKDYGRFFFKETVYHLESPTGELKSLSKTELDYINDALAKKEIADLEAEKESNNENLAPVEKAQPQNSASQDVLAQNIFDALVKNGKIENFADKKLLFDVSKKLSDFIQSNSSDTALFYSIDWLVDKHSSLLVEDKLSKFLDDLLPQEVASTSEDFSLIVSSIMNVLATHYPLDAELKRIKEYKRPDGVSMFTGSTKTYKRANSKFTKIFNEKRHKNNRPDDTDSKPKFSQSSTIGDRTITQATEIEPSQKLKDMIELSKKRVHSVGQAIVDEHHFLAIGTSALTGQPIYALFNDDGRYFVVDIDSAKSNAAFSQEVIDKAKAVKQKLEQQDADFVKKYPDGVFSGTDAQVVSSESVSKKVTAYLDSLLKMLGIETRVFLATQKDINADAQAKYHIYGGHRSILSVQISTEESGVTRIIGINQKDSKDAYIAFNSDMSEEEMIEVVAHEVGHIIEKTLLRNAPKETQEAIKADFEKWLASVKGITKKEHLALMRNRHIAERDMQNKADIMDTPNTNLSLYWFSFSEWFADNVSRWATTSEKPLSLVEKFFAKVAKKLKQLVHIIQESKDSYKPSVSVRDYLDSIVRTDFTNELYNDEDFNADSLEQSDNQDTDSKPKFSQSSTIGDRTITQVRDKLISRFGKRIIELLESKGILKIHQSMSDKDIPAEAVKQSEGVTEGFYLNGTVHLIADNLTDETIIPTFVHELGGHKGFQEMMSPKAYELIMQQFDRLVAQGNAIAIKAKQRAEKAEKDTARQQDEYIPYLLTEQEKAQFATPQERNAVKRLIDHILRAVKGWVVRTLSKYNGTAGIAKRVSETLDARDIQLMAERMIKDIAKRGGDNNNSPKFSKTEQSQFDRLLAKADKMIAEQGKLLAPNGKPSKLNRVQWAQVRTDNFKAWFGDWENDPANASKAVDDNGEPLVVYHGSGQEFYIFDKKKATDSEGRKYGVGTGKGVFSFTENNDIASNWANRAKNRAEYGVKSDMPTVISAFLNIKRPITRNEFESMLDEKFIGYDFRLPKIRDKFISEIYTELKKKKIDGIMSDFGEITAFYPTQIKSAISNNGEFSPTNPDIRFSRAEDKAKADKMIAEQGKLLAPNGKPSKLNRVQWAQVRTDNFKAWFGDWENDPENASKVVDENGEPLVVYRADTELYNKFDKRKARQGFFFTSSRKATELYNGDVRDFFLSIKNPLVTLNALPNEKNIIDLKNTNFDGVHNQGVYGADEFIVATSTQIKSATDNNGEFSPTNPDIRFSRAEDKAKAAKDYVLDSVRIKKEVAANLNAKKELGWWHKTLGTQQNTAIQHKDFGRVYKTLQRLLQHQSSDVTDALEVAPTLLEKLDDWKDFKNQAKSIGRNISQGVKHKLTDAITDRMAVAKVIFGETLAKKALTQDELEQKLNSQQLSMYEEARAAINVSLKNTAMSEIIRSLLQADAINFDTVEKHLNQQTGFDEFVDEMLENVGARISNAQAELSQATDKKQQKAIKEEIARLSDMYNSISNVNNKVYQLIDEAYAPLMRFGDYALTMRDKTTGKVLSFMMFESKAERNRMVNYLGTEYGNTVDLETDTMSTEDFKQFKGVTPETVALFAKELGLDKNEAYQGYLKLAIPATSALTRRIQRKGTAGFNEDIQRVLASFVMSNARYSAKNIYLAKADKEISEIESGASVRDQAKKMRDNTIDPVDTFAWLRDLLFVWNLGGSVMFAFLNMTQPFMQTIPMLSQYVNTSFATKHVLRGIGVAGKAMATGNAPKGYEAEYKRAVHEGIVDPQNTFMLTGLERGGTGTTSKVWTGTKHILGLFAQMSESLNRKATFIAALEVANAKGGAWLKQKGYASAYDFAVDVISQTQGVYNKANRSNWAHSPVGAPLLVFKQFSINYVEQMVRMAKNNNEGEEGKKAVLLMLFMLFSLAGGMGLPFIKDIFDGSETIAAFMGNPVNIEREMRLMGKEYFGETTTGALMDGWLNKLVIGEVLGADVQSRTSMGDLAPLTNFFNKTIYGTDQQVSEGMSIFGAAGGLGEKVVDSFNFMANNEWGNAFINILPRFATSMYRGVEMMTTGDTTDSKGRKLFDTTLGEGLVKFFDAQPVRMAELSRARGLEYDDIAIQSSKIKYYKNKWVKAAQKEDMEAIEQIEQDIQEWNENNEKYPVIFDRKRAYQTANKNDMTWGEREAKPPRGMEWLKEERPEM